MVQNLLMKRNRFLLITDVMTWLSLSDLGFICDMSNGYMSQKNRAVKTIEPTHDLAIRRGYVIKSGLRFPARSRYPVTDLVYQIFFPATLHVFCVTDLMFQSCTRDLSRYVFGLFRFVFGLFRYVFHETFHQILAGFFCWNI